MGVDSFDGRGYVGTLPDLTRTYEPVPEKKTTPEVNISKDFNSANEIKPVPRDNPAFVNIILKSDKTSQYVNDLNEFIPLLEGIYDLIEEESSVQLFNAKVYYFNKSADYFRDKYMNKPECQFVSFKRLMEGRHQHVTVSRLLQASAQNLSPELIPIASCL